MMEGRLAVLFFTLIFIPLAVNAANFTATIDPVNVESGASNQQLNFTIDNTDTLYNITLVNITFWDFSFVYDSNDTSSSNLLFYNDSVNATWENTTNNGFIENVTEEYFYFNVTVPSGIGDLNFTVTVQFTDDSFNETNVSLTLQDNIDPANINPTSPTLSNNSYTNADWIYVNVTFTELNPDTCLLELNNGTAQNWTMTVVGSSYCWFNATNQDDGDWNYSVYVNDTSNNLDVNGTWFVTVDTTQPDMQLFLPGNITYYNNNSIPLNFTYSDNNVDVCWYEYNNLNTTISGCSNTTFTPLTVASSTLLLWINDSAANINSTNISFTTCSESWSCSSWTTCSGSAQTRTCIDSNSCGTTTNKPTLSQSCTVLINNYIPSPPTITKQHYKHSWGSINQNTEVMFSKDESNISINQLRIHVINKVNNVIVSVIKWENKPPEISVNVSGRIYQYLEISHYNLENSDIEYANISFSVNKSWLLNNNLNKSKITLKRYTTQWNDLITNLLYEDEDNIYYEAESPGLSYFVVSGEEIVQPTLYEEPTPETISEEETVSNDEEPLVISSEQEEITITTPAKTDYTLLIILSVLVIGGFLVYYYIYIPYQKKKTKIFVPHLVKESVKRKRKRTVRKKKK